MSARRLRWLALHVLPVACSASPTRSLSQEDELLTSMSARAGSGPPVTVISCGATHIRRDRSTGHSFDGGSDQAEVIYWSRERSTDGGKPAHLTGKMLSASTSARLFWGMGAPGAAPNEPNAPVGPDRIRLPSWLGLYPPLSAAVTSSFEFAPRLPRPSPICNASSRRRLA